MVRVITGVREGPPLHLQSWGDLSASIEATADPQWKCHEGPRAGTPTQRCGCQPLTDTLLSYEMTVMGVGVPCPSLSSHLWDPEGGPIPWV